MKELQALNNALQCKISEAIYWDGFFKGVTLCLVIWGIVSLINYFKNKDVNVSININERKEPKL